MRKSVLISSLVLCCVFAYGVTTMRGDVDVSIDKDAIARHLDAGIAKDFQIFAMSGRQIQSIKASDVEIWWHPLAVKFDVVTMSAASGQAEYMSVLAVGIPENLDGNDIRLHFVNSALTKLAVATDTPVAPTYLDPVHAAIAWRPDSGFFTTPYDKDTALAADHLVKDILDREPIFRSAVDLPRTVFKHSLTAMKRVGNDHLLVTFRVLQLTNAFFLGAASLLAAVVLMLVESRSKAVPAVRSPVRRNRPTGGGPKAGNRSFSKPKRPVK